MPIFSVFNKPKSFMTKITIKEENYSKILSKNSKDNITVQEYLNNKTYLLSSEIIEQSSFPKFLSSFIN